MLKSSKEARQVHRQRLTGIAASQKSGDIYVMVEASQFGGPAAVELFGRHANANDSPLSRFMGRSTEFMDAEGIAVERCNPNRPAGRVVDRSSTARFFILPPWRTSAP